MDAFDAFLKGEAGLFDWHLAYQQTDAFADELRAMPSKAYRQPDRRR